MRAVVRLARECSHHRQRSSAPVGRTNAGAHALHHYAQAPRHERVASPAPGRDIGLEMRAGMHAGRVELRGGDVAGMAVNVAARVLALAGNSEVLVTRTVKDLLAGSGPTLISRGVHQLKGVPDTWGALRPAGGRPLKIRKRRPRRASSTGRICRPLTLDRGWPPAIGDAFALDRDIVTRPAFRSRQAFPTSPVASVQCAETAHLGHDR